MNAYVTYSENRDEMIRKWRADVVRDEGREREPKKETSRPRSYNPLAREEAIKSDDSHGD